jgi:hypothetical protein
VGRKCSAGGSLILASLIDKAGEALFQDFQDVYGLNLIHMIRDDVPPLEIILLIRGLKLGSRFVAVLQGSEEFVGWDAQTFQLATLIDSVNYTTWAVVAANSKRKPKEPKATYRPSRNGRKKPNNAFETQLKLAKERKAKGG